MFLKPGLKFQRGNPRGNLECVSAHPSLLICLLNQHSENDNKTTSIRRTKSQLAVVGALVSYWDENSSSPIFSAFKFSVGLCSLGCSPNQPFPYLHVEIPFSIFLWYIFVNICLNLLCLKYIKCDHLPANLSWWMVTYFKSEKWPFTCQGLQFNDSGHSPANLSRWTATFFKIRKVAFHLLRFAGLWHEIPNLRKVAIHLPRLAGEVQISEKWPFTCAR